MARARERARFGAQAKFEQWVEESKKEEEQEESKAPRVRCHVGSLRRPVDLRCCPQRPQRRAPRGAALSRKPHAPHSSPRRGGRRRRSLRAIRSVAHVALVAVSSCSFLHTPSILGLVDLRGRRASV